MMDESTFLSQYDKTHYDNPIYSIDTVLFTLHETTLKVLLVQRSEHPDKGKWALPGGFVDLDKDQNLESTVMRKLKEKTGVEPPYIEQLYTYGSAVRDKRGWSTSTCYTALVAHQDCAPHIDTVSDVKWVPSDALKTIPLAFDHKKMINDAQERLAQKARYSIVPAYVLPETFTLPELQYVHEILIGKPLQKKSFRRRIEQMDLLIDTGEKRAEGGRPASLYRMKDCAGDFTFIRNLEG